MKCSSWHKVWLTNGQINMVFNSVTNHLDDLGSDPDFYTAKQHRDMETAFWKIQSHLQGRCKG